MACIFSDVSVGSYLLLPYPGFTPARPPVSSRSPSCYLPLASLYSRPAGCPHTPYTGGSLPRGRPRALLARLIWLQQLVIFTSPATSMTENELPTTWCRKTYAKHLLAFGSATCTAFLLAFHSVTTI